MTASRRLTERVAISITIACFSAATLLHAMDVMRAGLFPYDFAPFPLNVFWTSLTLLDPAVVVALLAGWRRSGLLLAVSIMVADVAANSYALYELDFPEFAVSLQLQTAFLGFLLGVTGFLWPREERPDASTERRA